MMIEPLLVGLAIGALMYLMWDAWRMPEREFKKPEITEPSMSTRQTPPEFEQKAVEMFKEVKKSHPVLRELKIQFSVPYECTLVPPDMRKNVYGLHHPAIGNYHRVEIASANHDSEMKLYDTITHELAHALDYERRGKSDHSHHFHECKDEIELHAPKNEII